MKGSIVTKEQAHNFAKREFELMELLLRNH